MRGYGPGSSFLPECSAISRGRFEYWDADLSGSLDTQELTLALLHTFGLTGAARRADREMFVENVGVIIMLLDPNQDGNVDRDEWPQFREAIQLNLRA